MKKSIILITLILMMSITTFSKTKIVFWTAPNPNQEVFWKEMVERYNSQSKDIEIQWSTIPAAGSSEESILTAIASGRAPDISTNIFSGFAAQLSELEILVPLSDMEGFDQLIKNRKMENIIKTWEYNKKSYIIPLYSNSVLMWWRKDILKEFGWETPPRTYSDIYKLSKQIQEKDKNNYSIRVIQGRNWNDRWFDYITYFYAATQGQSYLDLDKYRANISGEQAKEIAKFIETMFQNKWTAVDLGEAAFYRGYIAGSLKGPWEIAYAKNQFPKIFEQIILSTPPVPDNYPKDKPVYTFADSKGLVIFETSKHKKEAWDFVKWIFSQSDFDKKWLEYTQMPPAREDLLENNDFKEFFEKNPYAAEYAKYVKYAIPPAQTTKTVDIQDEMTVNLIEPLMYGTKNYEQAIKDATKNINRILW
ncbi:MULTISPECIES: extracellular solute-binding protein [Oceanotoga]|nr:MULTISPECIES: ABC transporter substrate-binding protein [Oceanotoga]MDN5342767.1 multiple sugar transport system substrate-binding protein [Oceanotoga sp.]MDO7975791.1 ABC transporter substrate-binding protein [Oceanotoga teriensis]